MKINNEYLKGLLEAFEASDKPLTDIMLLNKLGFSYEEDTFVFHMDILLDKGLIESKSTRGGIGYQLLSDGDRSWSVIPLRLTAQGHEFISSLHEPDVWKNIQENFKNSSIDTIKSVAKDLAKGFAKKKVTELLSESSS